MGILQAVKARVPESVKRKIKSVLVSVRMWTAYRFFGKKVLEHEKQELIKHWEQEPAGKLETYLVSGTHDPRINIQSILARHYLIRLLFADEFEDLMAEEIRFGAEKRNRLIEKRKSLQSANPSGAEAALEELYRTFSKDCGVFETKWAGVLSGKQAEPIRILEPACGSANDYRFLHSFGIARFFDYKGFDLNKNNVENARRMFPKTRFELGNLLEMQEGTNAYEHVVIHDIFEHLSPVACAKAMEEVSRVARKGVLVTFFSMADIRQHEVIPKGRYYWSRLSINRVKEYFSKWWGDIRVISIGDLLAEQGFPDELLKEAYTFVLDKKK